MSARTPLAALLVVLSSFVSCADPQHDNEVSALGPEQGSTGPEHRRGQPCLTCHGGSGPGNAQFAMAGTVYAVKGQDAPLSGVDVTLTDANNSVKHATTNRAGNFFVPHDDWSPIYPVHVKLSLSGFDTPMGTHIGRDGSCGGCHFEPRGSTTPGHVYFVSDPADLPPGAK
jgi:hypothetical protein